MKLVSHDIKVNWPIISAWWSGLWCGLMIGFLAFPWFARSRWIEMRLAWPIPVSFVVIAFLLPRTIQQFYTGVKRFRAAARRQADV